MSDGMTPAGALVDVAARLTRRGVRFALVGGLAVSIRGEVRFTRDVDLAIAVDSDDELEELTRALTSDGFRPVAVIEQDDVKRIAIVRLQSRAGIIVDLLAASSGIEHEIVDGARATTDFPDVPVAAAEHLLAMKVLSMRDARLQDRMDALGLVQTDVVDLDEVRRLLGLIESRGFARGQDLQNKLTEFLAGIDR